MSDIFISYDELMPIKKPEWYKGGQEVYVSDRVVMFDWPTGEYIPMTKFLNVVDVPQIWGT